MRASSAPPLPFLFFFWFFPTCQSPLPLVFDYTRGKDEGKTASPWAEKEIEAIEREGFARISGEWGGRKWKGQGWERQGPPGGIPRLPEPVQGIPP